MNVLARLREAVADRYEVVEQTGRGGMSLVFRARDLKHDREVAIKVLRPDFAATIGAERFLQEIRIEARLQHPNVVPLFDSGREGGLLYCVLPFIRGESLRERLDRERQLPVRDACRIAADVGAALAAAHAQNIVHRDIKPENVLLTGERAMVLDFGIARALHDATGVGAGSRPTTTAGVVVGTPTYMSPEQASADQTIDGRADIYSLAVMLYEMLAGEPPFGGRTPQAVLARHVVETPPPLGAFRAGLPPALVGAIECALAKSPADRFATAALFVTAIELGRESGSTPTATVRPRGRGLALTGGIALLVAAGFAAWRLVGGPGPLDAGLVIVFPLQAPGDSAVGLGWGASMAIGTALEATTEPRFLDGWDLMPEDLRRNPVGLTEARARQITRARGARYFFDGTIRLAPDHTTLVLQLKDVVGDSIVARETVDALPGAEAVPQLAVRALALVLPRLLDPNRQVDLGALRNLEPLLSWYWIQGELEYRRSRFSAALDHFRRAIAADSTLAPVALKAAQAASWVGLGEAAHWAALALRHQARLSPRGRELAHGLAHYLSGRADSAVAVLARTADANPDWAEAAMLLGEAYHHLLPTVAQGALDSLAEASFSDVVRRDPAFTPAQVHLAEYALRRGDFVRADQLIGTLARAGADSLWISFLGVMRECLRRGPGVLRPLVSSGQGRLAVLRAAKELSVAGADPSCAEAGFRAVLSADSAEAGERWGALLGLQGVLVAVGRAGEAARLLDSSFAAAPSIALLWHVADALAGAPVANRAAFTDSVVIAHFGPDLTGAPPLNRWVLGAWRAARGDGAAAARLAAALAVDPDTNARREKTLASRALAAHAALAAGDTARATAGFGSLRSTADGQTLTWEIMESLPVERLRLAELHLRARRLPEAYRVAAIFDHPQPIVFLPFLPASLVIRARAANALGLTHLGDRARDRLRRLGRTDLLSSTETTRP